MTRQLNVVALAVAAVRLGHVIIFSTCELPFELVRRLPKVVVLAMSEPLTSVATGSRAGDSAMEDVT